MNRLCSTCGEEIDDKRQSVGKYTCFACEKAYKEEWRKANKDKIQQHSRQYYLDNRDAILERMHGQTPAGRALTKELDHIRRIEKAKIIAELKASRGCADCGEQDPMVLQFHHDNATDKKNCISQMYRHSMKRIMEEAEKCTVLCANCHIRRHKGFFSATSLDELTFVEKA